MPGLLDLLGGNFGTDDPRQAAYLALAAGLMSGRGSFGQVAGQAAMGAQDTYMNARKAQQQSEMTKMQMEEIKRRSEQAKLEEQKQLAQEAEQLRIKNLLASAFTPVTGGEAATMGGGPTPAAATMQGQTKPINYQLLIAQGVDPKLAEMLAKSQNFGKQTVARTVERAGAGGRPETVQLDDYGNPVGQALPKAVEAKLMQLGGTTQAYDPFAIKGGQSFAHTMTPEGRDSSARGWAGVNMQREKMAQDKTAEGKPPSGYRWSADGRTLESIPGGPADEKASEKGRAQQFRSNSAIDRSNLVIKTVDDALAKTGPFTTGLPGALLGGVPGTTAYDLRKTVDTVKANIGFGELQAMREASPTGGALGQVAVQELMMLQAVLGNLDANQSEPVVRQRLGEVKKHYDNWKKVMSEAGYKGSNTGSVTGDIDKPGDAAPVRRYNPATGKIE